MSKTLSNKDEAKYLSELKTSLIGNTEGEPTRIITDAGDLTERKMAEEIFQTISLRSPVGMYVVQDGQFVFANPRFLSDLGWTEGELMGASSLGKVRSEDREMVRQNAIEMLKGIRTTPYEYAVTNNNGETKWFMETVTSIQYQGRRAVLGNVLDITDRKQTEERLRETRRRFRDLVNLLPLGVYEIDKNYTVTFANQQAIEAAGFTEAEVNATPSNALTTVIPKDRERMERNIRRIMNGKQLGGIEYTCQRKDGSTYPAVIYSTSIVREGKAVGLRGVVIDITERKQAEESLQQTQRRFRELVDLLPLGVFEIDNRLNIIFANQQAAIMLGYEEADINNISLYALDACAPEDQERMKASIERIMNGLPLGTAEFTLKRINGTKFPALIHATPIMRDGQVAGLRGVITDITERKQVEEIFQTVSMSSPASIYIIQDGKFVFANNRFLSRMGFTEQELLDVNPYDILHPEDREKARKNTIQMLKGKRTTPYEYRAFSKTGEMMWVAETVASIHYQGKLAVLGSALNITEQKQADEALRTQKELTDHILDTIPDAVLVVGEGNKVLLANTAFYDTFGMKKREVVGISVSKLILEPSLLEIIPKILLGEKPQIDLEFKQKLNGDMRTLVVTGMKMGEKETLLILNDVTEERQKQERLFLTDRLSSIGEMSAGVAHELNNPLTGIVSLSQLLIENNPPDELREDISDIHNEAQRAASIVRNLLTFSRKHAPVRELTQLNDVIEDVLRLREYEHKVNNIKVETQLAPDLPEVIFDYHQIQQVFLNIVLNAESAVTENHKPGTLTITTSHANGNVNVTFSDDGPGIPQENLNRLFDPFFTTKEVGKGTGLGLSICYGIVTQHGGKIYASNNTGKGATFVVELPVGSDG